MDSNLTSLLHADAVPMERLRAHYGVLLDLVEKLIGVIPNCDPYLEIWPPAFRTYNVLVPNFLNLPFMMWGVGAPKEVVGLAMYAASRAAGCAYCSAHTTAFALRRGTPPDKIARALDGGSEAVHTPAERAAIAVAEALAKVPCKITEAERREMAKHYSPDRVEWIVLGVAMMGFLNKFMDAVGVELEGAAVNEVRSLIGPSGWKPGKHMSAEAVNRLPSTPGAAALPRADTLGSKLSILPLIPSALAMDRAWTAGVPKRWPAVGAYLLGLVGAEFRVLSRITQSRAIRAIAVMLRDNLDARESVIGLPVKAMVGLLYATMVGDAELTAELRALAAHHKVLLVQMEEVERFAKEGAASTLSAGGRARAALVLARAASPSPAEVSAAVLDECKAASLQPDAIVEIVAWLSLLQMLHRLGAFYPPS